MHSLLRTPKRSSVTINTLFALCVGYAGISSVLLSIAVFHVPASLSELLSNDDGMTVHAALYLVGVLTIAFWGEKAGQNAFLAGLSIFIPDECSESKSDKRYLFNIMRFFLWCAFIVGVMLSYLLG